MGSARKLLLYLISVTLISHLACNDVPAAADRGGPTGEAPGFGPRPLLCDVEHHRDVGCHLTSLFFGHSLSLSLAVSLPLTIAPGLDLALRRRTRNVRTATHSTNL
jgi:hypothetical protein